MMKFLRSLFIQHITFIGDFADMTSERRKWANSRRGEVIVVNLHYMKAKVGKEKRCRLTLYYVEDNAITRLLGFRHDEASFKILTT